MCKECSPEGYGPSESLSNYVGARRGRSVGQPRALRRLELASRNQGLLRQPRLTSATFVTVIAVLGQDAAHTAYQQLKFTLKFPIILCWEIFYNNHLKIKLVHVHNSTFIIFTLFKVKTRKFIQIYALLFFLKNALLIFKCHGNSGVIAD